MSARKVVVVGASRLGCRFALSARAQGWAVTLVDEHPQALKSMALDAPYFYGAALPAALSDDGAMLDNVLGSDDLLMECIEQEVDLRIGTIAWGAFHNAPNRRNIGTPKVALVNAEGNELIDYDALVLATGTRDFVPSFKGWDLPGVFGVKGGSMLLARYQVSGATRVLVLGSSPLALGFARLARDRGVEIAGLVDPSPTFAGSAGDAAWLKAQGIAVHLGHVIAGADGVDAVRGARLVPVDGEGAAVQVACDGICMAIATLPNVELPSAMGCRMAFDDALGAWMPEVTPALETSVPAVYWLSEADAAADPVDRILSSLAGKDDAPALPPHTATGDAAARWVAALSGTGGMDVVLCQCEGVTRGDFLNVAPPRYLGHELRAAKTHLGRDGTVDQDLSKRMTRVGMGHCQGKRCRDEAALLLAGHHGLPLKAIRPASYRFPVRPLDMALIAAPEGDAYTSGLWQNWPEPAELRAAGGGGGHA
ncbi:MAG: FAD-dependent oxidoreductase [Rubellimicrobium sp.]|nr:FAD-dependent oxidoreductase [Rubellimicrobium sp.]